MTPKTLIAQADRFLAKGNLKKTREKLTLSLDQDPSLEDLKILLKTLNTLLAFEIIEQKTQQKKAALLAQTRQGGCPKMRYLETLLQKGFL
jgi:hypothetical protein